MIGVSVVGYGYWGPNLVRNFWSVPGATLVSVCDARAERLSKVTSQYPAVEVTGNYDDVLNDPRVHVVAIATPVSSHYDLALRALKAGKNVFIEKPMTATAAQAEILLEEANRRNLIVGVDHTFVYTGAVRKMRELVQDNSLGDIYYYDSVRVNLGLFQHDVNVIWDLAVHDLSIMDYVIPHQPVAVSATGVGHVAGEPENIAYMTLFFEHNLIAHLHVNWLAPVKVRRTLLGGSRKMIVYDDLEPSEKIKVYDKGITVNGPHGNGNGDKIYQMMVGYRTGDMWAPQLDMTEALSLELRQFVKAVDERQTPLTDGQAGLRVVRILEAATQSLAARGRVIELDSARITA
jgi:predicted dehydrogenase